MNEADIFKLLGSAGGGMALIFLLARAGLLKLSIGNGNRDAEFTEFMGYTKASLDSIKEKVESFSKRLDQHLTDEENKLDEVREELTTIKTKLK